MDDSVNRPPLAGLPDRVEGLIESRIQNRRRSRDIEL